MTLWLAVAGGGAVGSLARWQLALWLRGLAPGWPWGTLLVNVLGCLLIGWIAGSLAVRPLPEWLRLGLMTGLLGGFTTFSAFSLETLELLRHGAGAALLNVAANLLLALAACAAGLWLGRLW